MTEEGPLEELEKLIKDHFGELIVSLAVSAKGSLFLSCWQQTSELPEASFFMEYLPMFYLIGSLDDESKLYLKLISYHGIVIDNLSEDDQPISSDAKIGFIKKLVALQLCGGVEVTNGMKVDTSSYLIEKLEQKVFVRSRHCNFGVDGGRKFCDACKSLGKEISYEKSRSNTSFIGPNQQRRDELEISNMDPKSVPTSQATNTFSLANVKLEAKEDEPTTGNDEEYFDIDTADKLMGDADTLLSDQHFNQDYESEELPEVNKPFKVRRYGSKRLRLDRSKCPQVGPFLCDQCGDTFAHADELKIHIEVTSHQSKETAICFQCGDILESRVAFRKHLWLHEDLRPYKCRQCDFTSTVKEHIYKQHSIYMHGRVGTEDDVELLLDVMEQIDYYEKNNGLYLGSSLTKNGLENVKKSKRRKSKISSLGRLQHSCSQPNCHSRYQSYKDLKKHYQETGHRAKHVCFLCGEVAPRDVYLRNHIISVHLELKPYKCVHCPFTSALPDKIYNGHYKRMHGNGEVGTKQDVVSIPEVLKIIEEFEEVNKSSLLGLTMLPPPLEEWPSKEDNEYEEDTDDYGSPTKRPKKSTEPNQDTIKEETFDEVSKDVDNPDNFVSHQNRKVPDVKQTLTSKKSTLKECCIRANKGKKGKLRHKCDTCLFVYDSCEAFEEDQNKHQQQSTNQEAVNCPTCAVTVYKVELNQHFEKDHPELKAGCCIECLVVVVPKIKMQRHFVTIHKPKNLCPICGKHFRVVKDHMAVKHSNSVAKDHICEVCGKKFRHSLLLQSHVAKMHTARKSFPCKFCGQLFKEKCTLTTHYWSMHMKVKPYKVG